MKRCPECRRDYYDEMLLYCLDDGAHLVEGPGPVNEAATAILSGPGAIPTGPRSPIHQASRRNSIIAAALGIAIVTALGVGSFLYYGRGPSKQIDSIAVMPFVNLSGNADLEYLSDGITETLISKLSQVPDLSVKARSSVFRYKGKEAEAQTIARELNVHALLNGTIVQRGQDLALHVELIDARNESVLWSEDYQRPLSNLLALQAEIAREVASGLKTKLSGAQEQQLAKNYTSNPEGYQQYLKGRFHFGKRTKDDIYKAIDYFRQAVALDPTYALAYSGLADAYLILGGYDYSRPRREFAVEGRTYALKAIALDDSLSQAHNSMGLTLQSMDHNFTGAEAAFRRAIKLDSANADALSNLGNLLTCTGRMSEAEAAYRRAVEVEPVSAAVNRAWGAFLMYARRYDESAEQLTKTIDLEPNFILSHLTLANVYMVQGKYSEAVESYVRSRELMGQDPSVLAGMRERYAKGGWPGFIAGLDSGTWPQVYRGPYIKATQYVSVSEKEKALAALEKAYEERDGFITLINIDPRLDPLRDDPRFKELVKKVGF